jgi:hypothetical protein
MLGLEVSWVSILRLLGWERKAGGGPSTGRLTGHTYFGNQARILISGAWGEIFSQFFSESLHFDLTLFHSIIIISLESLNIIQNLKLDFFFGHS